MAKKKPSVSVVDYDKTNPLGRDSKYGDLFEALEGLEVGKAVLVDIPDTLTSVQFRNRISNAVRYKLDPPEGYSFRVEVQEGEEKISVFYREKTAE